ncbi:MAG: lytE [Candidatus Paceibacter sp.]|jgi:hypothetical protein|nr:lytE [Candidatus Paceibacter sp.]
MKKHIITTVLAVSMFAPVSAFAIGQPSTTIAPSAVPTVPSGVSTIGSTTVASSTVATSSPVTVPVVMPRSPEWQCISITRILGLGSRDLNRDGQVTALQNALRSSGDFKVESTGYFGPLTLAAVKSYQKKNGIPNTGLVGPMTRGHINPRMCGNRLLPISVPTPTTTLATTSQNMATSTTY